MTGLPADRGEAAGVACCLRKRRSAPIVTTMAKRRRTPWLALAFAATTASCGEALPVPVVGPPPARPLVQRIALAGGITAPPIAEIALAVEALASVSVERIPLPAGPPLTAVVALAPDRAWLLDRNDDLVEHDGQRVRARYSTLCEPHGTAFAHIEMKELVWAEGAFFAVGQSVEDFNTQWLGRLQPDRHLSCRRIRGFDFARMQGSRERWVGMCSSARRCRLRGLPASPLPELPGPMESLRFFAVDSPTRAWIIRDEEILRFDGVSWRRLPAPDVEPSQLVALPDAILLAAREPTPETSRPADGPDPLLMRHRDGRWERLSMPDAFAIDVLRAGGDARVLAFGAFRLWVIEGDRVRVIELPFEQVTDAAVAGDALWVVGSASEPWERVTPWSREPVETRGAAVRVLGCRGEP